MGKQIVGMFDTDFSKIIFYEIMDNWNEYTILRKQGTNEHYLYNNEYKVFTHQHIHIINIPEDKSKYDKLIDPKQYDWAMDPVFFWADSRFVTDYGLPGYDKLIELYKNLIEIRYSDFQIAEQLSYAKEQGWLTWLLTKLQVQRLTRVQKRTLRRLIKEFKVIW